MTILRRRRDQSARHARDIVRWRSVVGWVVVGLLVTAPALHAQIRCNAGGAGGNTNHIGTFNGHTMTVTVTMGPAGLNVLISWRESGSHSIGEAYLDDGDGDFFHSFRWSEFWDHTQKYHWDHPSGSSTNGNRHWDPDMDWDPVTKKWIPNPNRRHGDHAWRYVGTVMDRCENMLVF